MQIVKTGLKYAIFFVLTAAVLTGLLVLSARIPRAAIRENVQKSAEYLCEGELFGTLNEGVECSKIDRYADSILLAIAYQYDEDRPLSSVMRSAYYYTEYQNENVNLLVAVTQDREANQQYLRYWHGSNVIVRPLLVFFSLKEIYVLNGIVLTLLIVLLLVMLIRDGAKAPAAGVAAGLLATSVWYVPFSLEYTWTYLLMLLLSMAGWKLARSGNRRFFGFFFLLGGMLTSFVDFLTTETLTLLVPLLLILWADRHEHQEKPWKKRFQEMGRDVCFWGFGYVGMWMTKWLLAAVALGENVMPYVTGHIEERIGGNMGIEPLKLLLGAIIRNISCLFPVGYGTGGRLAGLVLLFLVAYIAYVYYKRPACPKELWLYALPGLVPYVRYSVLQNHSFLHFFFTYRAQLATVLAVVLILEELIGGRWHSGGNAGRRKP